MNRWQLLAALCGAVPLFVGVSVFALWSLTRETVLELAGLRTIGWGLVASILGFGALLVSRLRLRRVSRARAATGERAQRWCAVLLLANFPAAALCLAGAGWISSLHVVTLANESGSALEDPRLSCGGEEWRLDAVAAGEERERWIRPPQERTLRLSATWDGRPLEVTVDAYVLTPVRHRDRVTVGPGGSVRVE